MSKRRKQAPHFVYGDTFPNPVPKGATYTDNYANTFRFDGNTWVAAPTVLQTQKTATLEQRVQALEKEVLYHHYAYSDMTLVARLNDVCDYLGLKVDITPAVNTPRLTKLVAAPKKRWWQIA